LLDRLIGYFDYTLGQEIFDIPGAEGEAQVGPHQALNDVAWEA
jgi:hypothetical protein